uniref:C2H2-type domain-containing protein n=1 Tax=Ditylenchus dipsaci TaxID=166011 RepID=A0A915DUX5_9BILA
MYALLNQRIKLAEKRHWLLLHISTGGMSSSINIELEGLHRAVENLRRFVTPDEADVFYKRYADLWYQVQAYYNFICYNGSLIDREISSAKKNIDASFPLVASEGGNTEQEQVTMDSKFKQLSVLTMKLFAVGETDQATAMQSRLCSIQLTNYQMEGIAKTLIQAISFETQHAEVIAAKKQIAINVPLPGTYAQQNVLGSAMPQVMGNQTADGSSVQVRGFGYANTVESSRIASSTSQQDQPSTSSQWYAPHPLAPGPTSFSATNDYSTGAHIAGQHSQGNYTPIMPALGANANSGAVASGGRLGMTVGRNPVSGNKKYRRDHKGVYTCQVCGACFPGSFSVSRERCLSHMEVVHGITYRKMVQPFGMLKVMFGDLGCPGVFTMIAQQHHHRDSQEYVKQRLEAEAIQEDFARGDDLREVQPAGPPGGGEDIHEVGGGVPTQDISQFMMKEKSDSVSVLDKKILNFLASNCLPFSIVEEKSFKNLLSINDRTSLQGRRHYSDWVLHRFYKEMKNKSKEKLSMITSLSFTTDIWSGPTESFIRFAMENTGYDHLNCAAHMLNLVVKNSITEDTELMELLQKCRSLVAHFRHSNLACERLREEQEREETPLHHLIFRFKDVPTRWNSTYDMCERLIEQKKAIEVYLARYKHRKLDLEETEWDMVGLLVNLLVMAKEASDQLCRDESSTSIIIPVYCKLKAFMNSTDQLNFRTLKTKFMKLLEDKFYLENSTYIMHLVCLVVDSFSLRIHVLATFLDPRFKDYYSANTLQFNQKASKWLLEEVGEQEGELDAEQDLSSPAPKMIRKEKSFFDDDDDEVPRMSSSINIELEGLHRAVENLRRFVTPDEADVFYKRYADLWYQVQAYYNFICYNGSLIDREISSAKKNIDASFPLVASEGGNTEQEQVTMDSKFKQLSMLTMKLFAVGETDQATAMQSRLCSIQLTNYQMEGIAKTLIQAISFETQHAEVIAAKKQIAINVPLPGTYAQQNVLGSGMPQVMGNQTADGSSVQVRGFGYANTVESSRIASSTSQQDQPSTSSQWYAPHPLAPGPTSFSATNDYSTGAHIAGQNSQGNYTPIMPALGANANSGAVASGGRLGMTVGRNPVSGNKKYRRDHKGSILVRCAELVFLDLFLFPVSAVCHIWR